MRVQKRRWGKSVGLAAFAAALVASAPLAGVVPGGGGPGAVDGAALAEERPADFPSAAPYEFFLYVKKGEYIYAQAPNGGLGQIIDQNGQPAGVNASGEGRYAESDGVWKIKFTPQSEVETVRRNEGRDPAQPWSVGVRSADGAVIPGRVWVERLNLSQYYEAYTEENLGGLHWGNLEMYVYASNGYQYRFKLNGINGIESVIYATSSGINKVSTVDGQTVYTPTNQSFDDWKVEPNSGYDAYAPSGKGDLSANGWQAPENFNQSKSTVVYPMFFERPAGDLPKDLFPDVKGISDAQVSFVPDAEGSGNGFAHISNLDKNVTYTFSANGVEQEITGSEKAAVRIEAGDSISEVKWKLTAKSQSQVHFMLNDVERLGGIQIQSLNGTTAGDSTVYWDDSSLKTAKASPRPTGPVSALDGVDSSKEGGVHGWLGADRPLFGLGDNYTYGDGRIIDTWAQAGDAREWEGSFNIERPAPGISIVKKVQEPEYNDGDTLHWTFTVTNTGQTALHDVKVVEDEYTGSGEVQDLSCPKTALAVGEAMDCTAITVQTEKDVEAGKVENTAHPEGRDPGDKPVKGDPSQDVSRAKPKPKPSEPPAPKTGQPSITLVKKVQEPEYAQGDTLHWDFTVTNTGQSDLVDVKVVEDEYTGSGKVEGLSCPKNTLAVNESMSCTATSTASDRDVQAGKVENTAHPEGKTPGGDPVKGKPSQDVSRAKTGPAKTIPTTGGSAMWIIGGCVLLVLGAGAGLVGVAKRRASRSGGSVKEDAEETA